MQVRRSYGNSRGRSIRRRKTLMTAIDPPATRPAGPVHPSPPSVFLHGLTAAPADFTWDGVRYTGARLASLDMERAKNLPGVVDVVVCENFVGVTAIQRTQAALALAELQIRWETPVIGDTLTLESAQTKNGAPSASSP